MAKVLHDILLLFVVYGGLSIAALLLLIIGVAIVKTRIEVVALGVVCATLVLIHVAELVYLFHLGQVWIGDGIDPMVSAGAALVLIAGGATILFVRRRWRAPPR